jgi:GDP-4-dehydro-6-deoxy-D-mannose reductase
VQSLLVTGANGFVGKHLAPIAAAGGFSISGTGRGGPPESWNSAWPWYDIDLTSLGAIRALPREWWGVIHLAAVSIPAQYTNAAATLTSLEMLMNLTQWLAPTRLLCVSSCHVYGPGTTPKRESERPAPRGAYGVAKAMAELHALAMQCHSVRVARPFNHVGTGMHPDLFIPTLFDKIKNARNGEPIVMDGRNSVRDFLDVADICRAYLALVSVDNAYDNIFNVCSGQAIKIGDIAAMAVSACNRNNAVIFHDRARSSEDVDTLLGDPSRLRNLTGWAPQVEIREAIQRLADAI